MGLVLAFKAFIKALKEPEQGKNFVEGVMASKQIEVNDQSHISLLHYLQQASRLIDFLKEDISSFQDAQVGAAVRKIHHDCGEALEELVTVRPFKDEQEGTTVQIPKGFDPSQIKIVGKVKGEPPYTGILIHRGWKAQKRSLPKKSGEQTTDIICPAEVEIR